MSARVERAVSESRTRPVETIVNFTPDVLKAPFLLRSGAVLIDYILLISAPVITLILSRMMGNDGTRLLNSELAGAGWLIAVILAVSNFIILPMFSGQSLGKMLTGIRIVKSDGHMPQIKNLLLRHLVGYPVTFLTGGLGLILIIFNRHGRALHDYLGGTIVIYGRRKELD